MGSADGAGRRPQRFGPFGKLSSAVQKRTQLIHIHLQQFIYWFINADSLYMSVSGYYGRDTIWLFQVVLFFGVVGGFFCF